jgi:hypothetical protein
MAPLTLNGQAFFDEDLVFCRAASDPNGIPISRFINTVLESRGFRRPGFSLGHVSGTEDKCQSGDERGKGGTERGEQGGRKSIE